VNLHQRLEAASTQASYMRTKPIGGERANDQERGVLRRQRALRRSARDRPEILSQHRNGDAAETMPTSSSEPWKVRRLGATETAAARLLVELRLHGGVQARVDGAFEGEARFTSAMKRRPGAESAARRLRAFRAPRLRADDFDRTADLRRVGANLRRVW